MDFFRIVGTAVTSSKIRRCECDEDIILIEPGGAPGIMIDGICGECDRCGCFYTYDWEVVEFLEREYDMEFERDLSKAEIIKEAREYASSLD